MKQLCTKQFNSNDVMSLHRDMTAVKTPNETYCFDFGTEKFTLDLIQHSVELFSDVTI